MLTKEEMKNMLIQMAEYLESIGLNDEEVLGAINIAKIDAILSGTYKDKNSKTS